MRAGAHAVCVWLVPFGARHAASSLIATHSCSCLALRRLLCFKRACTRLRPARPLHSCARTLPAGVLPSCNLTIVHVLGRRLCWARTPQLMVASDALVLAAITCTGLSFPAIIALPSILMKILCVGSAAWHAAGAAGHPLCNMRARVVCACVCMSVYLCFERVLCVCACARVVLATAVRSQPRHGA